MRPSYLPGNPLKCFIYFISCLIHATNISHRNCYPILREWEKLFPRTRDMWWQSWELAAGCSSCSYDHFSRPIWEESQSPLNQASLLYFLSFYPVIHEPGIFPPPKDHNGINPSYQNGNIKSNLTTRSWSLLAVVYWQFYAVPWHYMSVRTLEWVWTLRTVSYILWLKNTEEMEEWWGQCPGKEREPHKRLREGLCSFFFSLWEPGKTLVGMLFFLFWGCICETQSDWSFKRGGSSKSS